MIRPININLNAAHPELPLVEATTFTGAPSSVFIRGVPKAVGNWSITAVSVAVTYPDNTTTARAAVESAEGVWVATIPGTATSGRTAAGFKIMADGIDENGDAVTGYVLGFADFSVLSFTPVPAPGGTFYLLRYFDQSPATPKEGDVAKIDGVLKFYNGSAWEPFAASVTLDDAVTRMSANGVKSSGIWSALWGALSALPAGFTSLYDWCVAQLAGKQSKITASGVLKGDGAGGVSAATAGTDYQAPLSAQQLANIEAVTNKANDNAVVHRTGNETVGGVKTFDSEGVVVYDSQTEFSLKLLGTGIVVTDGYYTANFYVPNITGGGGTFALLSDVTGKADRDESATSGNLAKFDSQGNPIDSQIPAANVAVKADLRYTLVTKTISNGAVSLDDRAINAVAVSSSLASLTVNFPTATSGRVRDFGLRLTVASGITTAPELALPQGVVCENADGEAPEIGADGAATILYFTETASGVFLVKGEVVTAIS